MSLHVKYEVDFDQVKDLQDGTMSKKVSKAIALSVKDGITLLEQRHKFKYFIRGNAASMKTHPTKITYRTGSLAQSYLNYHKGDDHFGYYGSTLKRAALLEYGDKVSAKPGKALAIPTPAARVGVGGSVSPKNFPDGALWMLKLTGRNPLLMNRETGQVMFFLLKSVTIPPRPVVKKAAKDIEKPFQLMMAKRVAKAMEKT